MDRKVIMDRLLRCLMPLVFKQESILLKQSRILNNEGLRSFFVLPAFCSLDFIKSLKAAQ